jgi:hypothetical protein
MVIENLHSSMGSLITQESWGTTWPTHLLGDEIIWPTQIPCFVLHTHFGHEEEIKQLVLCWRINNNVGILLLLLLLLLKFPIELVSKRLYCPILRSQVPPLTNQGLIFPHKKAPLWTTLHNSSQLSNIIVYFHVQW